MLNRAYKVTHSRLTKTLHNVNSKCNALFSNLYEPALPTKRKDNEEVNALATTEDKLHLVPEAKVKIYQKTAIRLNNEMLLVIHPHKQTAMHLFRYALCNAYEKNYNMPNIINPRTKPVR